MGHFHVAADLTGPTGVTERVETLLLAVDPVAKRLMSTDGYAMRA